MPRALWKGAISFGLVHVPVELYPAAQRHSLDLDWLDKRTLDPIGYKKINKSTGKEVKAEQIVKGYEYEKGRYVVLGEEDFKRANPVATQTVEILAFIAEGEVPAEYFDTPYYLAPGRRGEKVYALLREAMKHAKRQGLAHVVLQTKQHLALVYPQDRLLMLNTLRYADEIRESSGLELPAAGAKGGVKSNELKMALRLIEEMTERWDPDKYRDTYRDDILKRVRAKVKAGETREAAEPEKEAAPARQKAEVIDLVALLRQSVRKDSTHKPRRARKTSRAREKRARAG